MLRAGEGDQAITAKHRRWAAQQGLLAKSLPKREKSFAISPCAATDR